MSRNDTRTLIFLFVMFFVLLFALIVCVFLLANSGAEGQTADVGSNGSLFSSGQSDPESIIEPRDPDDYIKTADVAGLKLSQAVELLKAGNIPYSVVSKYDAASEIGTVFDTDFSGYTEDGSLYIEKGTALTVYNSLGDPDSDFVKEGKNVVYFTIDDGPSTYEDYVLGIFDTYNVKATFFTIGQNIKKRPEGLLKIYNAGHLVACHTYSHQTDTSSSNYIYASSAALKKEIEKWEQQVVDALGFFPENSRIIRFPGGSSNIPKDKRDEYKQLIEKLGYRGYDWSFGNNDGYPGGNTENLPNDEYLRQSFVQTANSVKKKVKISLLHDRIKDSREQIEFEVIYLLEQGYVFDTLDHFDGSWYRTK